MQKWIYALAVSGKDVHEKAFFQSSNLIFSNYVSGKVVHEKGATLNWRQNGTLPRGKDEKAIKNYYF